MADVLVPISFRIPRSLKKAVQKAAAADRRSQTSFVLVALETAIAQSQAASKRKLYGDALEKVALRLGR